VDKILKRVEQTAKALGITYLLFLLARANEVIEIEIFLLRCMSLFLMWWTAPAPGIEVP
jgi:hypothetical protein